MGRRGDSGRTVDDVEIIVGALATELLRQNRTNARERGTRAGSPSPTPTVRVICEGGSNSVVESQPSKLLVAGSIPVSRSSLRPLVSTYEPM